MGQGGGEPGRGYARGGGAVLRLLVAIACLLPSGAWACSCGGYFETRLLAPPGTLEPFVPSNTAVFVGEGSALGWEESFPEDLAVVAPNGDVVDTDMTHLTTRHDSIAVLRSTAPMTAKGIYEVHFGGRAITGFRTQQGPNLSPPSIPTLVDAETKAGRYGETSCSPFDGVRLELEHDGVLAVVAHADEAVEGGGDTFLEMGDGDTFWVGSGGCTRSWMEADPGVTASLVWGAFDGQGQFSGWSEPHDFTVPPREGCDCQQPARRGSGGGGFALLPLLWLRRRRMSG